MIDGSQKQGNSSFTETRLKSVQFYGSTTLQFHQVNKEVHHEFH